MSWAARLAVLTDDAAPVSPSHDPDPAQVDAALDAEEEAAIQAEGAGDPMAPTLHAMPCSWADPEILPTPGAYCRNCSGSTWWTEATAPKGWRCSICHPGHHLPRDQRQEIRT